MYNKGAFKKDPFTKGKIHNIGIYEKEIDIGMEEKKWIAGFLHYRTDLGDGMRSGVFFGDCPGTCSRVCSSFSFLKEHDFGEDTKESRFYSASELIAYLLEEKTLCSTKELGISFLGKEPMEDPVFCRRVGWELKKAGMNLQIFTCGTTSPTAFDMLFGVCDLFVINLFSLLPKVHRPFPDFKREQVMENISYLDRKAFPYRLRIPVLSGVNEKEASPLACFASNLKHVKSVILDFTHSGLDSDAILSYRLAFLERGVFLY